MDIIYICGYIDSEILAANMDLIYESVSSSSKWGGYRVKGKYESITILASCEYQFIRVHDNLVQHPSNNISSNRVI